MLQHFQDYSNTTSGVVNITSPCEPYGLVTNVKYSDLISLPCVNASIGLSTFVVSFFACSVKYVSENPVVPSDI